MLNPLARPCGLKFTVRRTAIAVLSTCWLFVGCSQKPADKALDHYRAAKELADDGNYEQAIVQLSAGLDLHPTYSAMLHRGYAWMMLGNFDFARVDFLKARKLGDRHGMASSNLALLSLRAGDLDKALEYSNEAIESEPIVAYCYTTRAQIYERQGHYGLALADYNTAVVLAPEDAVIFNNRGTLHSTLGDDKAALADYSKALKLEKQAICHWNRGMVLQKRRDYDKALREYTEAAKCDPLDYSSYVLRGALYEELGQKDKAAEDYRQAKQLNPNWSGPDSASPPPDPVGPPSKGKP